MPTKDSQIISIRVNRRELEYIRERAEREGKSLSEILKESMTEVRKRIEIDEIDEKMVEIGFVYGITPKGILDSVNYLLESGKLYIKEGKIQWNPKKKNPDYISVDDEIERLEISENQREQIKRQIISEIRREQNEGMSEWA